MKLPPAKLVLTCTGNVSDKDLEERLAKIKTALEGLSKSKGNSVNLSKVEPWNSVRVTFNIPKEAAARLRELAQRGDLNLHKLGILTVQVENGETISLPPPPPEAQRSLFSPPPPTPSGTPQLPPGPPLVPPSPTPVSSPVVPALTPTPGMMVPGHGLGASVTGPNFAVPGVSVQQITRPSLQHVQGLQTQGVASLFSPQGAGNLWNSMGVPQQRPLQPPPSFWNQIPQFFPQVNMTQANQPPQVLPSGPQIQPVSQPKPQPKKRRKRTKKANIQPPELAVAAGQPLLPLPPHLQSLPTTSTSTQDSTDNFNTSKPSNLTLPPSLIDNPISPNTPPSTAMSTSATTTAPVVASSVSPGTQFSFTDIPISRGLVPSPQTQLQLLQKKTDVALTSPLLVNLLQSDISAKQFPFSNSSGGKTTSTGTDTPTTGQPGPSSQETLASPAPPINSSSPFMIGNGIGTLTAPNSVIPNMSPFVTSQGNIPGYISTAGQFIPPSTLLQAQSGQLSQEQLQFQLSQLSAAQLSQVQAHHAQSFQGHMPQGPIMPGSNQMPPNQMPPNQMPLNQMPPGHMQPFQMPGGHHLPGQPFPGPMPHSQLPNARMSIGPIITHDPMSQGQMRLGGPMHMGHMPRPPMSADRGQVLPNDPSPSQSRGHLHHMGQLQQAIAPLVSTSNVPGPPSANPMDTWNTDGTTVTAPSSSVKEKQELSIDPQAKKAEQIKVSDAGTSQPGSSLEISRDNSKKPDAAKQPEEDGHVFDEEAALLGMTEAERDTMAVAAIIAKEAKMAADAKNGKAQQSKEVPPPKPELQSPVNRAATPTTTVSVSDGTASVAQQATSTPSAPSTRSYTESHFSQSSSRGGLPTPPVADRRSSNSPVRLSPPKIPESVKQRRTPPSSSARPVQHQQPQYGPIPGSSPSSMSSGIAGLQTLTSRTFSASAQPSIRDMAITRNPEHNTLSQFLSSVTPPTEILQMAPLFRSSKPQDTAPKSAQAFPQGPTTAPNDWLSLASVDAQKPLPLPAQIGARTPMQPAEFSAATERMLGSILDTQKPTLANIERPPNQPRVITTEGINFMHKLVGRAPPSNIQNQPSPGDAPASKKDTFDQATSGDLAKREDKSQLKALLNEIVIPEKCPYEKQFLSDDSKAVKPQTTSTPTSADSHSLFPPATSHQVDAWLGFNHPAVSVAQAASRKTDSISSNITSIYIPPPVIGQQQQQQQQLKQQQLQQNNQPLPIVQQTAESSNVVTTASALASQRGIISSPSGFGVEGKTSQSDSGVKSSIQTPPPMFQSHSMGTLSQAVAAHIADENMLRFSQQGLPSQAAESMARDSSVARPSQFLQQSFPPGMLAKSPIPHPQPPSLPETPMTVLERAPKILLSPATLSTASEELIKSLGAHGTIATLTPEPEAAPAAEAVDTKQDKCSVVQPPAQQLPQLTSQKPFEDACPDTEASKSMDGKAPVHASTESSIPNLESAMMQTKNQSFKPSSVTPRPPTPATQLKVEQQVQHTVATPEVEATVTEPPATNAPVTPMTTFESAAMTSVTTSSTTVQSTTEVSHLMQMSKMTLSQVMATSTASEPDTGSHPEASISSVHPSILIQQQPAIQTQPALHDSVPPSGERGNALPSSKIPGPVPHSETVGLKSLDYQTYSSTKPALEKTLKSSPEKLKQLNIEATSNSDESEADKNTQQMHKKAAGDKRMGQQIKTSPVPVASLGHATTTPPATVTTPVKPTIFSSASSTLVQAQSIMVKTAAMSRTSGILKAAEQTARPVRSRTPPRASLSTLPPNTCNNESLGSASALLSSIAKSAWTVTTAMASAAKAKVVPTPKATDKNLTRMRRSPETLPPVGKMAAGERDRGGHEMQTQQSRTPPASAKPTSKTPAEPSLESSLPSVKSQEGSPPTKGSVQQQPPHHSALVPMEQPVSSAVPAFHAALPTSSAKDLQQTHSSKAENESASAQSLAYSIISSPPPAPTISSPPTHPQVVKSHSVPGMESTSPVRDSSANTVISPLLTQVQKPTLQSTHFHSNVEPHSQTYQAVPSIEEAQKPQTVKEVIAKDDQKVPSQCEPRVSVPQVPQATDDKQTIQTTSEASAVSTLTPTCIPIVPSHTSVGETSKSSGVETVPLSPPNNQNSQDKAPIKSTNQPAEATIVTSHPGPTVTSTVPQTPLISPYANETATVVVSDDGNKNTPLPEPLAESRKRMHTGDVGEPAVKLAKSDTPTPEVGTQDVEQPHKQDKEANKERSTPTETKDALPILDGNSTKQDTLQNIQPSAATVDILGVTGQLGQSKEKQEVLSPTETHPAPKGVPSVPEITRKVDPAQQCERIPETTSQCSSQSDVSPEPSLLSKPDQITNLVEKAIQMDPDKGCLFEKASTSDVSAEMPRYLSGQHNLEHAAEEVVQPPPSQKTEMITKHPEKEPSKDGGVKMSREPEGELEPRRTRHTSEEVPGMSTRSLRSGRRSPGELVSKGKDKEKEESPPITRGRGQKEKEIPGESEADALSRKRSTRSSGRDMYYGPIPSYKRRKTNQK
ncbi:mucin-17-like isoform X2 [Patiria miniata]|uniref:Nuclear receptor coactivator 6 TRADD-N domain-containing protein n=1 Tax=Patiria miniata TaxID=46514 RepID=A0A914A105_PATMI|nr:mucin-17-like isoform X2 [Patiria miniata]